MSSWKRGTQPIGGAIAGRCLPIDYLRGQEYHGSAP